MRVQATDADLKIGTVVYRSATSKKAWTVVYISPPHYGRAYKAYALTHGGAGFSAPHLWIEKELDK